MNYRQKHTFIMVFGGIGAVIQGLQQHGIAPMIGGFIGFGVIGFVIAVFLPQKKTKCIKCGDENAAAADKNLLTGKPYPNRCAACGHTWEVTPGQASRKQIPSESQSKPLAANIMKTQQSKESVLPPTNPTKRIIKWAAIVFVASCLILPWQYTADRNGERGFHSRKPAGYSLLFAPPTNPDRYEWNGVRVDFGRLFIEWVALVAVTGMVWMLFVKPAWLRDDKANRPQKFIPPTGDPKN